MPSAIRIGVLGMEHDHVWSNLEALVATEGAFLVAGWDANKPLLRQAAERFAIAVHSKPEALLKNERLDAVYVFGSNARGADHAIQALERGLHVLIEKPMAADLVAADEMLAAARASGACLMINWPFAWWPQLQHAIQMALAGEIGELWQVKYRAAHAGPRELGCSDYFCDWLFDAEQNGAGALMDYCCYGCLLARALLGMPSRVTGISGRLRKEAITVDDNAMIVMEHSRALATAEGSWTQIGNLTSYVTAIYGTTGTLLVEPRQDGRLLLATQDHRDGEEVEVAAPPRHLKSSGEHFIHCIAAASEPWLLCQARIGRDVQEILEAGLISVKENASVSLPLPF